MTIMNEQTDVKANIQELFLTKMANQTHQTVEEEFHISDRIEKQNDKDKKLRSENKRLQRKIDELVSQLKVQNDQIRNLRNERFAKDTSISELSNATSLLKEELGEKNVLIHHMEEKIATLEASQSLEKISDLEKDISKKRSKISSLLNQNNKLKQQVKSLSAKIDNAKVIRNNEEQFHTLKSQLLKESKELEALKQQTQNPYSSYPIKHLIHVLHSRLTCQNVQEFQEIKNLYDSVMEIRNLNGKQKVKKAENIIGTKLNFKYGHLIEDNGEWCFYSIDDEIYRLNYTPLYVESESAVKMIIENDYAYLVDVYPSYENMPVKSITHKTQTKHENDKVIQDIPVSDQNCNVLIVGAKNKKSYMKQLRINGYEVDWHNPFEDSNELLYGKIDRADIVLLCPNHMSHNMLDVINLTDPKVEVINRDNKESILVRTRYAQHKLGLISNN